MLETTPKLSVVMITYNHENYIEQAVRSALMQETDFNFEIVIGEDCSTDRTREILIELHKEHPDKIRLVLNSQNLGMIPNFVNVLSMAQGEYIALCEGDDYWTSPHKLQRQVDYLNNNPSCVICSHFVVIVDEDGNEMEKALKACEFETFKDRAYLHDFLAFRFLPTGSVVFRKPNSLLPTWYSSLRAIGDYPLFVLLLVQYEGYVGYLREYLGAYRKHTGGVWTGPKEFESKIQHLRDLIHDMGIVDSLLKQNGIYDFVSYHRQMQFMYTLRLVQTYSDNDHRQKAKQVLRDEVFDMSYIKFFRPRWMFGLLLKLYFPRLYQVLEPIRVALR